MSKVSVVLGDKLSGKFDVAQGYITIKDLVSRKEVDTYDPEDRDSGGYQRMVSAQRVKTLAKRLLDDDLYVPTSILVNIRDFSKNSLKSIKGNKDTYNCEFLINCAGLFSDEIAKLDNMSPNVKIIPFRGEYYKISNTKNKILNNMIYPLADPDLPFLGIHLTKTANGDIEAGPNAVLAFSKEGYKWTDINFVDLTKVLTFPGMLKLGKKYFRTGISEMYRSLNKKIFVKEIQKLINGVNLKDIKQIPSGVRAQAVDKDGNLVDDFLFEEGENSLHVLNSPSPAATASLAIGESIVSKILN